MRVEGTCLRCGATVTRETTHPEKWTQTFRGLPQSVWVICSNHHIGGVIFHKAEVKS